MYYTDTPEQIARCLDCRLSECINCAAGRHPDKTINTINTVYDLFVLGKSDRSIAAEVGINRRTVRRLRGLCFPRKAVPDG